MPNKIKTYKYKDVLTIYIDEEGFYIKEINCSLPLLGEGADRKVFDLSNGKCLKVAKNIRASCINFDEITLYNKIKNEECIIKFPKIFKYEKSLGLWYVCEKINMSTKAMDEATRLVPILDQSENAGYNNQGELTIVDADRINYTWFLKKTNPIINY